MSLVSGNSSNSSLVYASSLVYVSYLQFLYLKLEFITHFIPAIHREQNS